MNREIKFRGYNRKNNQWLYGFYLQNRGAHFVCPDEFATGKSWEDYEIDPGTLGQFTGLHDKKGNEIYEGDIVTIMRTPEKRQKSVLTRHIVTCHNVCDWVFESLAHEVLGLLMANHSDFDAYRFEVIGNIFDTPELAQSYSLNLPKSKPRKRSNKGLQVEFVVKDEPKKEAYEDGSKIVFEVTQEEMNDAIESMM